MSGRIASKITSACLPMAWLLMPQVSIAQPADYRDIPPGFDFPADEATLLHFRDTQNVAEMRRHGWYVWAGLTQPAPGGEAVWETWFSGPETFAPAAAPEAAVERRIQRRFQAPRQFMGTPGEAPEAIGASLLSFTLFNEATRTHIRDNNLHLQPTLTAINNQLTQDNTPAEDRRIEDFPREAVSLKTVWWAINGSGLTALPVWDFDPANPNAIGNNVNTWRRLVAIDPSRQVIAADETSAMTLGSVTDPEARVIPLNRLYHFELTSQEQVDAVNTGTAAPLSLGRPAELGDYVALVALHYTTKEIPDWVWGTFWWHDKPNEGPYGANRPPAVAGVWRNYLMDVAYSMVTPREFEGTPNSVYNPWLEAGFANGLSSNCMTCHQRSVWRNGAFVPFLPVTAGGLAPDDPYFNDSLQLDFLWSLFLETSNQ